MKRHVNLRQVEAFKAVIERGTVSAAAEALFVSQPAVSKLLANLEEDCELRLFERVRGKLAPTGQGMRLYAEIDRVFAGLRQVEQAIESIHRDEEKHLTVGVLQALSGSFINRIIKGFLANHPGVLVTVHNRDSYILAEWLSTQQIDVALISTIVDNPYIERDTLVEHPLVCVLPPGHRLCKQQTIHITDLEGEPFITFPTSTQTRQTVDALFEKAAVKPRLVMEASTAPTICEGVAAGIGISLVHPLFIDSVRVRLALRQFIPQTPFGFQLCRNQGSSNVQLVDDFLREARRVSDETAKELMLST